MPDSGRKRVRLVVFDSHPIQYHYQYYRLLALDPGIDLRVFYCWDTRHGVEDPSYGKVKWDLPLLEGYQWSFLSNWSRRPGFHFGGQVNPAILGIISSGDVDVVWVWGYASVSMWLAAGMAWIRGIPLLTRGEATLKVARSGALALAKEVLVRAFVKMTSGIAYSCAANRRYYEHFGADSGRLVFAPCAVDNEFFAVSGARMSRERARAQLGIPDDAKVVLFIGRLNEIKRPWDLLALYDELSRCCSGVCLLLVGDGSLRVEMENDCESKGRRNVRFEGFRNQGELGPYYRAADVFVLTSTEDPSPKALNEAMALGLPVVVTDAVGTAEDLVGDGVNGYVVPVGEPRKLAQACREILEADAVRERMGAESQRRISEWTFERGATAIGSWVKEVCS